MFSVACSDPSAGAVAAITSSFSCPAAQSTSASPVCVCFQRAAGLRSSTGIVAWVPALSRADPRRLLRSSGLDGILAVFGRSGVKLVAVIRRCDSWGLGRSGYATGAVRRAPGRG
jgi:hypothetical protein